MQVHVEPVIYIIIIIDQKNFNFVCTNFRSRLIPVVTA